MSGGAANAFALLQGLMRTQAVYVAAELGVADALAEGPLPLAELAQRVGADADSLHRYLRALATEGLFTRPEPGTWANTAGSEELREPGLRDLAHLFGTTWYRAFGASLHAVRTGEASFPRELGREWWAWLEEHPAEQARFDRAMHGGSDANAEAVAALAWRGDETVVDVGGGLGALLVALLRRHEGMRGVLFEREMTAREAERTIASAGLSGRIRVVAGSFFDDVPTGDAHVLCGVLHDWDDAPARAILARLGERVVIVDGILDEQVPDREHAWFDLLMLVLFRGRERTEAQWRELLAGAGYRVEQVRDGRLIEAIRA
jgi:O-methyltransferase domain/Dimerisation domain